MSSSCFRMCCLRFVLYFACCLLLIMLWRDFFLWKSLVFSPSGKKKPHRRIREALFHSPNWTRTSDTLINSQVLYRLSYGGIQIQRSPVGNRHELWRNMEQQGVQPAVFPKANGGQTFSSNLRRFVLANTYFPGPSPAKYFRHDGA